MIAIVDNVLAACQRYVGFAELAMASLVCIALSGCSLTGPRPKVEANVATPTTSSVALAFQSDGSFGAGLSGADKKLLLTAERRALDYGKAGEQIGWKGESADVSGTIVASQPFRVGQANCRRFEHKISAAGSADRTNGTACQRDDGAWRLVQ